MYKIELTGQARKDTKRLNPMMRERIKRALGKLAVHPQAGYKLLGKHSGEWSYPVGSYRIIYEILLRILQTLGFFTILRSTKKASRDCFM